MNETSAGKVLVQGRVVASIARPRKDKRAMTDRQLKHLFEQQERAERALRTINARIAAARRPYAERHNLLIFPSVEAMKRAVGA